MHNTGRKQALTMMRLASYKTINIEGVAGNYHVTSSWKNESTSYYRGTRFKMQVLQGSLLASLYL